MNYWNEIYSHFSPIAFEVFDISVHWYGLAYVAALFIAYFLAKYFARSMPRFASLESNLVDSYFFWAEVGVVIGARFGYLFVYTDMGWYYFTHPWEAFNPYVDGKFVGIAGMSYHGSVFGFLIASFIFSYVRKVNVLCLFDLIALSVPLAYIFGRIGNFLNKELYGREIHEESLKFIGIYVEDALRYPSQLIEAFLEGFVLFFVILYASKKIRTNGILIVVYALGYSAARFVAEYFREPDSQMGYYFLNLSMGQILSFVMVAVACVLLFVILRRERFAVDSNGGVLDSKSVSKTSHSGADSKGFSKNVSGADSKGKTKRR